MKKIILIGGGGHCHSCIDVIEQESKFEIIGIIDAKEKLHTEIMGYEFIGTDNDIENLSKDNSNYFLITIGQIHSPQRRVEIFNILEQFNANIATVISPSAYISKHSTIGKGTIVHHGAIINSNSKIGKNCIINSKSLVEHDSIIEDHCHISTSSVINGMTIIKEGSFVGSNSTTQEGVVISKNSLISANRFVKRKEI